MNNKRIVIDAGHGGQDTGAVGNGIVEKDLTLKIAKYIKNRFDELGIDSTLTRDSDITLNPTDRVNRVLDIYGNDKDVIVLSNHINAGGGDGAEIIYALRNNDTLSKAILNEISKAGQNVRKVYQRRLTSDPSKDYYYMLRNTPNTESIIVEYGFLDSKGDDVNLLKNNYEQLAEAVVKAVANYIGVPYNTEPSYYYTVQKGDTLWSIAKKFNTSVDKLKDINNINNNLLSIGQKLLISEKAPVNSNYYIVKRGDTLYGIAKKYNISVDELKNNNNLNNDILSIGQQLLITNNNTGNNIYTVKPGDTLYSIARLNNTTVSQLADINNLNTTILSIGQQLIIPKN